MKKWLDTTLEKYCTKENPIRNPNIRDMMISELFRFTVLYFN